MLVCGPERLRCFAGALICRRMLSAYIYGCIMVFCNRMPRICMLVGQLLAGMAGDCGGDHCNC